jgi:chromosome segregation ATPase
MGESIAELFAKVEQEAATVRGQAGAELDRARRDAERIAVAAADDRQSMLEDARESVRQMKAEAQREIAEFDSQVAQARARAENAAAAQLAELDRRLEARELAAQEPTHTAMTEVFPPAAPRQPEQMAADAFDQWTPAPFDQENED